MEHTASRLERKNNRTREVLVGPLCASVCGMWTRFYFERSASALCVLLVLVVLLVLCSAAETKRKQQQEVVMLVSRKRFLEKTKKRSRCEAEDFLWQQTNRTSETAALSRGAHQNRTEPEVSLRIRTCCRPVRFSDGWRFGTC